MSSFCFVTTTNISRPDTRELLLQKLQALNAGAVSGRRIYLTPGESRPKALRRFGSGMGTVKPFRPLMCEYVNGAKFSGDIAIPVTNAIILTRKSLLRQFPFDDYYARGNGYREETDFQMNLFVNGFDIHVTNDCHSFHLPLSQVRTGGQRTSFAQAILLVDLLHALFLRQILCSAMRSGWG